MSGELWAIKGPDDINQETLAKSPEDCWDSLWWNAYDIGEMSYDEYVAHKAHNGYRAVRVRLVEDVEPSGKTGELRECIAAIQPPMTMTDARGLRISEDGAYTEEQLAAWEMCRDAVLELLDEAHGADGGEGGQ